MSKRIEVKRKAQLFIRYCDTKKALRQLDQVARNDFAKYIEQLNENEDHKNFTDYDVVPEFSLSINVNTENPSSHPLVQMLGFKIVKGASINLELDVKDTMFIIDSIRHRKMHQLENMKKQLFDE